LGLIVLRLELVKNLHPRYLVCLGVH
jgi:hypothetical protein